MKALLCGAAAWPLPPAAASETLPAPPQKHPILLRGATVHTVSGETHEGGQVLFAEGRITSVGSGDATIELPPGTEVVDLHGRHVFPGLIAANTTIGLVEIDAVRATVDVAEAGEFNANARVEVSVNPDSEVIPVTRANGVLTALTVPQSGGLISGRSALMALDGWTWEDMTLKAPVGLHVFWPRMRAGYSQRPDAKANAAAEQRESAEKAIDRIREFFAAARAYAKSRKSTVDLRLEAMGDVLDGTLPVFIHASEIAQIESAVAFAERENIAIVLVGGHDAWRVPQLLRQRDIPVILSPQSLPLRRGEAYDTAFVSAAKLASAGVRFCIANEGSAASERNLPYQAAAAAAHGLAPEEALRAVTLYPAQILGVGDRLGSLEAGKDATLIVTSGDPLEITTQVEAAYIQGRRLDLSSRHTRLYEKYRGKYEPLDGGGSRGR